MFFKQKRWKPTKQFDGQLNFTFCFSGELPNLIVCFVVLQEVVIQLLKDAMLKHPDSPGFLIDGFPREISQGVQFEEEVSHWTGRVYDLNLGTHIWVLALFQACDYGLELKENQNPNELNCIIVSFTLGGSSCWGLFYSHCAACTSKRIPINYSADERGWWRILHDTDLFPIEDLFNSGLKIFTRTARNNVLQAVFIVVVNSVLNAGDFVLNLATDKLSIWSFVLFAGSRVPLYPFLWMQWGSHGRETYQKRRDQWKGWW